MSSCSPMLLWTGFWPSHKYANTHTHTQTHTQILILGSECECDISASPEGRREHRRKSERITGGFIDSFPPLKKMRSLFFVSPVFTNSYLFHTSQSFLFYLSKVSHLVSVPSLPPSKLNKEAITPGPQTDKTSFWNNYCQGTHSSVTFLGMPLGSE